jgi:predicted enzyme related to lactoylglutathione lyase
VKETSRHATVSHFEIPARDLERAARFYREVFGWTVEPVPWQGGPYYKVRGSAAPVGGEGRGKTGIEGGLMPREGEVDQPLLVIHVPPEATEPLETWLARIVAAGGEIDQPASRIGDMGFFARFRDPEGNRFGLWQAL